MAKNNGQILDALRVGDEICGAMILKINNAKTKRQITYDTRCHCGHERTLSRQGMLTRLHEGSSNCNKCKTAGIHRKKPEFLLKTSSVAMTYQVLCDQWLPSASAIAFARGRV